MHGENNAGRHEGEVGSVANILGCMPAAVFWGLERELTVVDIHRGATRLSVVYIAQHWARARAC